MNFKKLTPYDYSEFKGFFAKQKYLHSAYSLSSIIVWSTEFFQPYGAVDGDTFIVGAEFTKNKDLRHLILPVSVNGEYTPEKLHRLAKDTGYEQYFFVTEAYINTYGNDQIASFFKITEQTAFNDYVYLTRDLSKLEGNNRLQRLPPMIVSNFWNNGARKRTVARNPGRNCIVKSKPQLIHLKVSTF